MQMENNVREIQTQMVEEPNHRVLPSLYNQAEIFRKASPDWKCCIYKVPEFIQKEKKECYRPSVISIGPVFYKVPQLQTMKRFKLIYLESFLQHPNNAQKNLDEYINVVGAYEEQIRDCYQTELNIWLSSKEFIEMIVLDAVFLLRFFMETLDDSNYIGSLPNKVLVLTPFIRRDVLLVENQIPFRVLEIVFHTAFPTSPTSLLIELTFNFFKQMVKNLPLLDMIPHIHPDNSQDKKIAHLLDFWCTFCRIPPIKHEQPNEDKAEHVAVTVKGKTQQKLPMTASQLSAAGIKFKQKDGLNHLKISFDNNTGLLEIPNLVLEDFTETYFRSFIFFDRCHYFLESPSPLIDLIIFLDGLINSVKDIQILQRNGILNNLLGSDEEVLNLFNNITKNIVFFSPDFKYLDTTQQVNAYANKPWNQWKAILRRDYFSHPWALISFIYAIIIFILTVLQTISGFTS